MNEQKELLEKFNKLTPEQRRMLLSFASFLVSSNELEAMEAFFADSQDEVAPCGPQSNLVMFSRRTK